MSLKRTAERMLEIYRKDLAKYKNHPGHEEINLARTQKIDVLEELLGVGIYHPDAIHDVLTPSQCRTPQETETDAKIEQSVVEGKLDKEIDILRQVGLGATLTYDSLNSEIETPFKLLNIWEPDGETWIQLMLNEEGIISDMYDPDQKSLGKDAKEILDSLKRLGYFDCVIGKEDDLISCPSCDGHTYCGVCMGSGKITRKEARE